MYMYYLFKNNRKILNSFKGKKLLVETVFARMMEHLPPLRKMRKELYFVSKDWGPG